MNLPKNNFLPIKHRMYDKELRLSLGHVRTREEYEAQGTKFMGPISMSRKASYYTIAQCERMELPVTDEELQNITHFTMIADCYREQCVILADGNWRRPCIPVFLRK